MQINRYKVKITFTEPVLGSQPTTDIAAEFVAKKAQEALTKEAGKYNGELPEGYSVEIPEELMPHIDTPTDAVDKATTVFPRLDGEPMIMNYQVKGFLKESANIQNKMHGFATYRDQIGKFVHIPQRYIQLNIPHNGDFEICSRPLRAMTAQGPRVSLARSEQLPAGTWFEFELHLLLLPKCVIKAEHIKELLDYGKYIGLGQWRSSGSYGTFDYTFETLEEVA